MFTVDPEMTVGLVESISLLKLLYIIVDCVSSV